MSTVAGLAAAFRPAQRRSHSALSRLAAPLRVAVVSPADNPALRSLPSRPDVTFHVANDARQFAPFLRDGVDALLWLPPGDVAVLSEVWDQSDARWVHGFYAGVDALAPFISGKMAASEVPLTNGRGAFSASLAEYIMASCLHFNKQVARCLDNRRLRKWDKFPMAMLAGKTIGFVGFGDIAHAALPLATAFGMRPLALRRRPGENDDVQTFAPEQATEMLSQCDFVVSTLPGTPQTVGFFGPAQFAAMKETAVFVSCGRGVAVQEAALARALREGQIAAAALDVFEVEPLPPDSPLWECENLLLTAHNADFTDDYFELGWNVWVNNLECLMSGRPMATPVDKTAGY